MNAIWLSLRSFLPCLLIAIVVLLLCAAPTLASETSCFASSFFRNVAGDRSKIIQISIVFVLVGIALLFKK